MENLKIYVGTYAKYNNGSIAGEWLDLLEYDSFEELKEAIRKIHRDEIDPEYMFQDWECDEIFESLGLISESYISDEIYNVIEALNNSYYDVEIFNSYCNVFGLYSNDINELIERVEESYCGEYSSDTEFVENLLEETVSIPENLPSYIYIDWERTARDIMMDYSTDNDYYFRNY